MPLGSISIKGAKNMVVVAAAVSKKKVLTIRAPGSNVKMRREEQREERRSER